MEAPRPEAIRGHPRAAWLAVGVVCLGAFMGQLDASIVTLTFASMEREFHAPLAGVQWVSLGYLVTLVALLAPVGRLSDARGRKLVYTYGFAVFTLASAACGLAPSLGMLVAFRLAQAAGAAMLQANSVALVTTSVGPSSLRLALGIQAGAQSVGLALGPTLGGLLTTTVGWRGVYWVNVPVGVAAVVAARYLLPRTRHFTRADRFDWAGAFALGTCTTALLLALSAVGGLRMPGWAAVLLFAVAAVAGAAFAARELIARFPLIPGVLLRNGKLMLALAGALTGYLVLFGPLVLIPQVLAAHGHGAASAGLMLSALPLGFGMAALTQEAALPRTLRNTTRGAAGALAAAAALTVFALVPLSSLGVIAVLGVVGLGLGVFIPANNTVIMGSAGRGSSGTLGGLVNLARGVGTTFGIALVTLTLHLVPRAQGRGTAAADPKLSFGVLALAAAAAMAISLLGREKGDSHTTATRGEGAAGAFG